MVLWEVGVVHREVGVVPQEVGVVPREVEVVLREAVVEQEPPQGEGEGVAVPQLLLLEACQSQEGPCHQHCSSP